MQINNAHKDQAIALAKQDIATARAWVGYRQLAEVRGDMARVAEARGKIAAYVARAKQRREFTAA